MVFETLQHNIPFLMVQVISTMPPPVNGLKCRYSVDKHVALNRSTNNWLFIIQILDELNYSSAAMHVF
jgi:hypothetical protein